VRAPVRGTTWGVALGGLAVLAAAATLSHAISRSAATPIAAVRPWRAPSAALVAQDGSTFTLPGLRGEPVALTFVSARCTDACPLVDAQFARAQALLRREHLRARLVTITLDPAHDTPAVMRALAARFDADPRVWLVASGSVENVRRVMQAFGVVAGPDRDDGPSFHSTFVYLLDADGHLRTISLASNVLARVVVADLRGMARTVAAR
jgi:protein SCO1/2